MTGASVRKRKSVLVSEASSSKHQKIGSEDWIPIAEGLFVLSASFSQKENSCLMNCVAAISRDVFNSFLDWVSETIDTVLVDGRRLYLEVLDKKGYRFNKQLRFEDTTCIEQIEIDGRKTTLMIDEATYGGTLGAVAGANYDEFFGPLSLTLDRALRHHRHALILVNHKWMAIAKSGENYILFNSHNVGAVGEICTGHQARAFHCASVELLIDVLAAGEIKGDMAEYHLHPVAVVPFD